MRHFLAIFCALAMVLGASGGGSASAAAAAAEAAPAGEAVVDAGETREAWYSLRLQGQLAGWSHHREIIGADRATTLTDVHLNLQRGPMTLRMQIGTRFVETLEGKPIEASSTQKLGAMEVSRTIRFTDAGMELTVEQGGVSREELHPHPKEAWVTPRQSQALTLKAMAEGARTLDYRTLDPSTGTLELLDVHMEFLGEEVIEVVGKTVPATHAKVSIRNLAGAVQDAYIGAKGEMLRTTTELGAGLSLEMVAADREIAMAQIDGPDILSAMLLRPNRAIAGARTLRQGRYELRVRGDDEDDLEEAAKALAALPNQGMQRVTPDPTKPLAVVVEVDTARRSHEPLRDRAGYLAATTALNHKDPKIMALLERALGDTPPADAAGVVTRLREFVLEFVTTKDLSIAGATASEVARTGQGDCTEHAVLLAALLRAAEIPSRVVTGLVYADEFAGHRGVFGYHMWTQAYVGNDAAGRWLDVDSTLPAEVCDATHIALQTSAMGDDLASLNVMQLQGLMGQIEIRVLHE